MITADKNVLSDEELEKVTGGSITPAEAKSAQLHRPCQAYVEINEAYAWRDATFEGNATDYFADVILTANGEDRRVSLGNIRF